MIPVPDAIAAYDRVTHLTAQPTDSSLLQAAALQPGMPPEIVTVGNALKVNEDAATAYWADNNPANAEAYKNANDALREVILNHLDIPGA